jgi:YVTN family beta-propeller protein
MRAVLLLLLLPVWSLAQDGDYVLVLNKQSDSLSFVNVATLKAETTVKVGQTPHELAIHPEKTKAYVSNVGANSISVIDLKSRKETRKITSPDFQFPHGITFTKDGSRAIVTSEQRKKIVIIDAKTDEIIRSIDTDQAGTHMVVLSPDGGWAFFTNRESNTVSVMDMKNMAIVANSPGGKGVEGIAISPDGMEVWAANRTDGTISVINAWTREAVAVISTGRSPIRVGFSADGKRVFVSAGNELYVYDPPERKQIAVIKVSGSGGVVPSPDGKYMYLANGASNEISVIDVAKLEVVGKAAVEQGPDGIVYWNPR